MDCLWRVYVCFVDEKDNQFLRIERCVVVVVAAVM
jgi:hypothetical protein